MYRLPARRVGDDVRSTTFEFPALDEASRERNIGIERRIDLVSRAEVEVALQSRRAFDVLVETTADAGHTEQVGAR